MPDSTEKQTRELTIDAISYSKIGHHSKAESTIKKALELNPSSNRLIHELAKIYLRLKQYEKALETLLPLSSKI
ncbi:MAG: tetratricopeptide repeat protein, partial [Candidatus Thermoplasmatota archaeon]|nr:tetratricopeptide repeat protein [Candidatus Thermoplasmatota archaeon]